LVRIHTRGAHTGHAHTGHNIHTGAHPHSDRTTDRTADRTSTELWRCPQPCSLKVLLIDCTINRLY
jgi:hypothetical protein